MKICWGKSPVTSQEVVDALSTPRQWHPKTVKTLLNRLVKKGAIGFTKAGRAYLYRPLVAQEDCVTAESESFLDRVFGGSLKPMVAHFVQHKKLSAAEIRELKRLLEEKK